MNDTPSRWQRRRCYRTTQRTHQDVASGKLQANRHCDRQRADVLGSRKLMLTRQPVAPLFFYDGALHVIVAERNSLNS